MCGRATLAMVLSNVFIVVASMMEMVIGHLFAASRASLIAARP